MTIKIILGSKSELKRKAVEHALQAAGLQQVEVVCIDTESGVNPQPVEELEIATGARNRALAARAHDSTAYALGIESGLIHPREWADIAYLVLIAPDGNEFVARTACVTIPDEIVEESRASGFQKTAGQVLADKHGCNHYDPHAFLTEGKWSRRMLLTRELATLFLESVNHPYYHRIEIAGVKRNLPIRNVPVEVDESVRIALFNLLGDWQLVEAAGVELAQRIPKGVDALLMPDGKAQALLHVLGRESRLPTFVARKELKSYMSSPTVYVKVKSITTNRMQELFLGAEDAAQLHGKNVAFVDDVVSTGGTLKALEALLEKIGARHVATLAVLTEGKERKDVIALGHLPLF